MAETSTALIPTETIDAVAVFGSGGLDPILDAIRAKALAEPRDVSTAGGRKAIASLAYRVAQSKTFLDEAGRRLVEEQKRTVATVDAERRRMRDALDVLKAEVRKPLTDWEAEQAEAEAAIASIRAKPQTCANASAEALRVVLRDLDAMAGNDIPANLKQSFSDAVSAARGGLTLLLSAAEQRDRDAAELARLRAEQAERERQAATERAKAEAERLARERAEAEKRAAEAHAAAIEQARKDAEERARVAHERAIAEAAARAEREKQAAIRAERERVEYQARQKAEREAADRAAAEAARREHERSEAYARHVADVDARAAAALTAAGNGQAMVAAIKAGTVPGVRMVY